MSVKAKKFTMSFQHHKNCFGLCSVRNCIFLLLKALKPYPITSRILNLSYLKCWKSRSFYLNMLNQERKRSKFCREKGIVCETNSGIRSETNMVVFIFGKKIPVLKSFFCFWIDVFEIKIYSFRSYSRFEILFPFSYIQFPFHARDFT